MAKWDNTLARLLPNILTLTALCAGLTAIRFSVQGNYALAVELILAACVLDGLDGRVARHMGGESEMGAELDSLADFLNFGVAPSMVLYFWALQDFKSTAWLSVLAFAMCSVIRLARFNVSQKDETASPDNSFFIGVPAPGAAILVLLPMFASFAFETAPLLPNLLLCFYILVIGLLMIGRFKTLSLKAVKIPQHNTRFVLLGGVMIVPAVLTFPWVSMVALCLCYAGVLLWDTLMCRLIFKRK